MRILVPRLVKRSNFRFFLSPSSIKISNHCYRCWMMMAMVIIGLTMMSRIANAFPPNVPKLMSTYSSIRRPFRTSTSLLFQLKRGGGGSNSNNYYTASNAISPTTSNTFIKRTPVRSSVTSQMSTASDVLLDGVSNTATVATKSNDDSKLSSLRTLMKERNIDIYLIPSDDPHLSGTLIMVDDSFVLQILSVSFTHLCILQICIYMLKQRIRPGCVYASCLHLRLSW